MLHLCIYYIYDIISYHFDISKFFLRNNCLYAVLIGISGSTDSSEDMQYNTKLRLLRIDNTGGGSFSVFVRLLSKYETDVLYNKLKLI